MTTLRLSLNWNLWYSYLWSRWSNISITPWFAYCTLMHNNEKYHDENAIIIVAANVVLSPKNTTIPKSTVGTVNLIYDQWNSSSNLNLQLDNNHKIRKCLFCFGLVFCFSSVSTERTNTFNTYYGVIQVNLLHSNISIHSLLSFSIYFQRGWQGELNFLNNQ